MSQKKTLVRVNRFCDVCLYEWVENADRERLRLILLDHSTGCPNSKSHSLIIHAEKIINNVQYLKKFIDSSDY